MDVGGYDAYRTEQRFAPWSVSDWFHTAAGPNNASFLANGPARYSGVRTNITADTLQRVRGGSGWDLPTLQAVVNKFVVHYDEVKAAAAPAPFF